MFSFLNTLEIIPVAQVTFISQILHERLLDAALMLKAKAGMPGHVSLNAWTAHADPLCCTIPTELVCCEGRRDELQRVLEDFCDEILAAIRRSESAGALGELPANPRPILESRN